MSNPSSDERQHSLRVLALSPEAALEKRWEALADKPAYRVLRPPQIGSAMIRGRIGGSGEPFNLGEMTMTRAAVQIDGADGRAIIGHGHVAGRAPRHAELIALFDALMQDPAHHDAVAAAAIAPLAAALARRHADEAARVAPSRVEFFTMVRER
ncbi:MAG TPA: phosphonate C-P lyase system protein PhnG [Stellaceae bacterium]|nr:phosphonate C-P lyase system protein PhnG [Stellaceae bacterium]